MTNRSRLVHSRFVTSNIQTISVMIIFGVLCSGFGLASSRFLTVANLEIAARQAAPTVIVAVAMTFVITSGNIDLSPGSLLAVTAAAIGIFQTTLNGPVALLLVLLIGCLSGWLLGYISAYQGVPAFIVTLAALTSYRGIAQLATGGYSSPIDSSFLTYIGTGKILGIYTALWLTLAVAVAGWYVFSHTKFGHYVKAVGSNAEGIRRTGVNIKRVRLLALVGTGFTAALAGVMVATRLGAGSSNVGVAFELEAITAVVLGGTSLMGGRGSIVGSVFGALTMGALSNGLVLVGFDVYWVPILQGLILVLAILANTKIFSRLVPAGA